MISIIGRSGSGKTTLLNICAGLLTPTIGHIKRNFLLKKSGRPNELGYVFQSPELIPWMTVIENVLLPISLSKGVFSEVDEVRAKAILADIGLSESLHLRPKQLSGGMKKRVGIARGFINDPRIIFLDEPLGELDEVLREELLLWTKEQVQNLKASAILVTHSIDEAIKFSDRVLVLGNFPSEIVADISIAIDKTKTQNAEKFNRERLREKLKTLLGETKVA